MASQFDADPTEINELFEGRKTLYQIPEYQRPYSWEKSHIDQLWDDLRDFFDFVEFEVETIQIETSDLSYAIRLFQTANTRGKDLTVSDLTKSYLLSPCVFS